MVFVYLSRNGSRELRIRTHKLCTNLYLAVLIGQRVIQTWVQLTEQE